MVAIMKPAEPSKMVSSRFSRALMPAYRSAQIASCADRAASFLSIRFSMLYYLEKIQVAPLPPSEEPPITKVKLSVDMATHVPCLLAPLFPVPINLEPCCDQVPLD